MSGQAKRAYNKELIEIRSDFSKYIKDILPALPKDYNVNDIIKLIETYYPFEWQELKEKHQYFLKKDKSLESIRGKQRYQMDSPIDFLFSLKIIKDQLEENAIKRHKDKFNQENQKREIEILKKTRLSKIKNIEDKRNKTRNKAQSVEPFFLDKLMGLYDRKTTTQKDKVYIFIELQKYYCNKTLYFFQKKNDTELNNQLREMAFYHLQELGHYVKLRKRDSIRIPSENKKRREYLKNVYSKETFKIESVPQELEYRIENSKEQRLKKYDFFISHSSMDSVAVQRAIKILNSQNKNVYCDWISDTDYLKRHLVGDATKKVIEERLR